MRLTPRAGKDALGGWWRDADGQQWLSVSVTAPPDKGKANKALIQLMARHLGLAPSSISLVAGETSRLKRLEIRDGDGKAAAGIEDLMEHR